MIIVNHDIDDLIDRVHVKWLSKDRVTVCDSSCTCYMNLAILIMQENYIHVIQYIYFTN